MASFVDLAGQAVDSPRRPRRRRGSGLHRADPRVRESVDALLVRLRVDGLSYRDIASLFNEPMAPTTIMRRVHRKLAQLEMLPDDDA